MDKIEVIKNRVKRLYKQSLNKSLMQFQHEIALRLGYLSWSHLRQSADENGDTIITNLDELIKE